MRKIISNFINILINAVSSIVLPLADAIQVVANLVSKVLNVEYEQLNKMTKGLDVIIKKKYVLLINSLLSIFIDSGNIHFN